MKQHRTNALGQPIGRPLDVSLPRPPIASLDIGGESCAVLPLDIAAHGTALHHAFAEDTEGRDWTYLAYGPFPDARAFTAWMKATCSGPDPLFHTILDDQGRPCGLASYLRIDPANGSVEVGHIHLAPRLQRSRAASEAMFLMMGHAFDTSGYRRYEWKCDALNAPSRRAALRLGFTYEGTFRQAASYKGRNRDTAWFSIIDGEWPPIRAAFKAWLAPENFDEAGRQRTPLGLRASG